MKNLIVLMVSLVCVLGNARSQDMDSVVTLPTVTITSYIMVNEELDKSFLKKFPDADDVVWSRLNKDYLAKFIKDDLLHQSLFKKNGYLKYDITYVGGTNLPQDILQSIKSAYEAYKISNAARVLRADHDFWIVNLEGLTNYVVLRAENGDLDEVKRFRKLE